MTARKLMTLIEEGGDGERPRQESVISTRAAGRQRHLAPLPAKPKNRSQRSSGSQDSSPATRRKAAAVDGPLNRGQKVLLQNVASHNINVT